MKSQTGETDIGVADRVVFLHISKAAGTSFTNILGSLLWGLRQEHHVLFSKLVFAEIEELRSYRLFAGHYPYSFFSEIVFPEGFIGLTFVREPVSRTLSHFRFLQRHPDFALSAAVEDELEKISGMTLPEIIRDDDLLLIHDAVNLQTKLLGTYPFRRPSLRTRITRLLHLKGSEAAYSDRIISRLRLKMAEYPWKEAWVDPNVADLRRAKKRVRSMAFFGITERMQESLLLFSYTFGLRPVLDRVRLNAAPEPSDTAALTIEDLNLIEEKVTLDQDLYEFCQGLFQERFNGMTRALLARYAPSQPLPLQTPLATEVLAGLLERHHEERRNWRNRNVAENIGTKYVHTPASDTEGAYGWYGLDISPEHGAIRWSGPELQAGFEAPCPAGETIRISFRILMSLEPDIIDGLELTADGTPILLSRTTDSWGAFIFTGLLARAATARSFVRLAFSVPRTIAPCAIDPANGDSRPLGILFNWLSLDAGSQPVEAS